MSERLGNRPARSGEPPVSPGEVMDDMAGMVRATVARHRADGIKAALWAASRDLGLPVRRVRAYWHHEVRAVLAWEYLQVQRRFRVSLEASCERMEAECVEIRKRLGEMERD